ncbi:hypothetical protein KOW79_019756 [Hemibagrus wyckioides]|uniref:Uncharacterized protein n=1 Tax=Hemibagrus wyckioides TaxID=337641 RepID=A0A9D3N820_9TELE|nr:hypothetical protein KOW79_019756 [Hemibagrus wyckioides]
MAFFKSFQESLSSVSVSSILDSVSSTVSNTVDGVRTAVNDVTYTVSDQLTEQVNTIISKKQGEDEDKGKKNEGEVSSRKDSDSRTGAGARINSKRHAYADEEEERREREKQEQERRNEEEQWEWCYAPSKGWYRKRRDPNQRETSAERQEERRENKEERAGVNGQLFSSNGDMKNLQKEMAVGMKDDEGGQKDTVSKTSAETLYCEDNRTEQSPNSNNDQTNGNTQDGHTQEEQTGEEHTQNREDKDKDDSDERRNSTSTKPKQNIGGGADEGGAVGSSSVERQLTQEEDSQEGETGSSTSRCSSVLKEQHDKDEATGSQGHLAVTEVSADKKSTEHSCKKERFRRCTLL